ncbi:hypothetical protein L950_0215800 [Sphingobacterium sp. IITKGP-BTPF85]|nr:hypothetical protein L950_0215800 [Sphingobacterium sp. IITKGP-BTPF85]
MKYLNLIRERGGIPQYGTGPSALPVPSSQEQVRQAIRQERRVELNNEGIRYRDIRRWKIGEQTINGNFYGMNFSGTEKMITMLIRKRFSKGQYIRNVFSQKKIIGFQYLSRKLIRIKI